MLSCSKKKYLLLYFILALFTINPVFSVAQNTENKATPKKSEKDTLKKHSPTKAAIFSAVLPGLGQAYNKKYWKIPIVYAAIGVPLYIAIEQNQHFLKYKNAYLDRINGKPDAFTSQTDDWILSNMKITRHNRDLMFIITGAFYFLNIVDATVDAYLFYFNVSDDLSLRVNPNMPTMAFNGKPIFGLQLSLSLR